MLAGARSLTPPPGHQSSSEQELVNPSFPELILASIYHMSWAVALGVYQDTAPAFKELSSQEG